MRRVAPCHGTDSTHDPNRTAQAGRKSWYVSALEGGDAETHQLSGWWSVPQRTLMPTKRGKPTTTKVEN